MDKTAIAKKICERYGITWDKELTAPSFQGKTYTPDMVRAAFMENQEKIYSYELEIDKTANCIFSNYDMAKVALLVA